MILLCVDDMLTFSLPFNVHVCHILFVISATANKFSDVAHSLDFWHKSKSIRKCLAKVSISKSCFTWQEHTVRNVLYSNVKHVTFL